MDIKTQDSSIAEAMVIAEMIKRGFFVFTQFSGKEPFDLVAYKDDKFLRVEVKSSRTRSNTGKSIVYLRSIRSNKTKNVINNFDSTKCDLLAVYIQDTNEVILIPSNKINVVNTLRIDKLNVERWPSG